jgi:hypothetical protein
LHFLHFSLPLTFVFLLDKYSVSSSCQGSDIVDILVQAGLQKSG